MPNTREKLIYADDFLDLFYVASAGQDKEFIKTVEMVVEDTPTVSVITAIDIANGVTVNEWISVKDRLPEMDAMRGVFETVSIALKDGRVVSGCYRNTDKEWWGDITDGLYSNITDLATHWMPLPQPPKGE